MISIEDAVFQSLVNLKMLDLRNNALENLTRLTFKGLSSLRTLSIANNNLVQIQESPFVDLGMLQELDLSGNSITTLAPIAFLGLLNLDLLSLNDNSLKDIPVAALGHVSNLHSLMLQNNAIEEIPASSFVSLRSLHTLNLDGNFIHTIAGTAFSDKFGNSIAVLSLKNNRLSIVPSEGLLQLHSVQCIDLSANPITVVDPDAFKGLENLHEVSLQSMPELEVVRSYSFSELESLEVIHLHTNAKLRSIEKDAFLGTRNLKYVDLHSNVLVTLDFELFSWSNVKHLDLRFNRWNCDCHLDFLPAVLQSQTNKTLLDNVLCNVPQNLENEEVAQLSPRYLECDVEVKKLNERHFEDRVIIGIIAGVSCLLLVVMIWLMWRSRHSMFGSGPVPITYRVPRSTAVGNGYGLRAHSGEGDAISDDRLAIADNEEQVHAVLDIEM